MRYEGRHVTCKQFIAFLDEYLAEALGPDVRQEFDAHIAHCAVCLRYLQSYRSSIELANLVSRHPDDAVPAGVPAELLRAILAARGRAKT
jgi:anti-sigma factor RsiW